MRWGGALAADDSRGAALLTRPLTRLLLLPTAGAAAVAHPYTLDFTGAAEGSAMFGGLGAGLMAKLSDPAYNISMENHMWAAWGEHALGSTGACLGERAAGDALWGASAAQAPCTACRRCARPAAAQPACMRSVGGFHTGSSFTSHRFGLPPAHYDKYPELRESFHLLSTSKDR